jgi:dUTP pyrophosphatase
MILKIQRIYPEQDVDIPLPERATTGSAGFDIRANKDYRLEIGEFALVTTGLRFEIPEGYEIQIRSRSGLALHHGVYVLNAPGTIDSDYRGPINVILHNIGDRAFQIKRGDRIAQLVPQKIIQVISYLADTINMDTKRGEGGHGSTGIE